MGLRTVEIIGPTGEILAEYEVQSSPEIRNLELPRAAWYIARAGGSAKPMNSTENAWAVTAPIWTMAGD